MAGGAVTVPIIVGFDVEPDGIDIPRNERRRWTGFERTLEIVRELRPRLVDALDQPVTFAWFMRMDQQIAEVYGSPTWAAETYSRELDELFAAGDEIGIHPHALRWDEAAGAWRSRLNDPVWPAECARAAFAAYREAFGVACRAHRYGDGFMSNEIMAAIRELGATSDLTLEPGRPAHVMEGVEGTIEDQFDVPRRPYRPDPADYRRPTGSGSDLWMVPLATADPDRALPLHRRIGRRLRHRGRPQHRPILLWAPWPSHLLWDIVESEVESGALTALPFMVRADTLLNPVWAERFESHLIALATHRLGRVTPFSTPSALAAAL